MATAGTASIFMITTNGDTELTAQLAGNTVEFNGGATPDSRGYVDSMEVHLIEDISLHPNPNRHLTQIQDGKLGTKEVIIKGFFKTPDSAGGITKLNNFMLADKTNASLPYGRFGIRYDNMSMFNLTPSASVGYILYDFVVKNVEEYQDKAIFTARLYLNGSPV